MSKALIFMTNPNYEAFGALKVILMAQEYVENNIPIKKDWEFFIF